MLNCSIGVMAYNEEKNIARLLEALLGQDLRNVEIADITVVASGCTDQTVQIVREYSAQNPKIRHLIQEKREGKASAVNLWLKNAASEILVLESADTIPEKDTIEKLVGPFQNPEVGMTGTRPVPINNPGTFMGFAAHLLWHLHHLISLDHPKMGEMVAFRKIFSQIPAGSAVDEAEIESEIRKQNYKVLYVPEAVVRNRGPETIFDFLKQRRRIHAGHLALKAEKNYSVSTMNGGKIFLILIRTMDWGLRSLLFTPLTIGLEIYGRFLGWYDFRIKKRSHVIWDIAESTKRLD